jgi:peroxiredoxin
MKNNDDGGRLMRKLGTFMALGLLVGAAAPPAPTVGAQAPHFTLTDSQGKQHSLSAYKGKFVVLEWVNYECPFVQKHYGSGHMQELQRTYTGKGVVWLAVNSSAPGKQGNFAPAQIEARSKQQHAAFSAYLIDGDGAAGRSYGAKTTPHMFLVDPQGTLQYAGGIDDKPSTDRADIKTAKNFVAEALDEALAGKRVSTASSTPYGCAVKY